MAEVSDDEGLQVKQPERGEKHETNDERQQLSERAITKRGKRRETKHGEVSERAKACERNAAY
ncbi:MAG: hypothetical protein QOD33_1676 [Pyrinomonadaceae bacterium]|nr:hypothetical protein [Pyrinomonadaceae bacterium]